jgi:hypothetical protein
MPYPNTGSVVLGYDRNFFTKVTVTATSFGQFTSTSPSPYVPGPAPDVVITFNTQGLQLLNLTTPGTSGSVVEYSFNGQTVHGELNPTNGSIGLTFDNRPVSKIWFRVQTGSAGPIQVSVQAWSIP